MAMREYGNVQVKNVHIACIFMGVIKLFIPQLKYTNIWAYLLVMIWVSKLTSKSNDMVVQMTYTFLLHFHLHLTAITIGEHRYPTNIFVCIRVCLPAARVGTVEDEVATYLHSAALQRASGGHAGGWHRGGQPLLSRQKY